MAEIVNLNRFRKDRARSEKAAKAAENRALHGQTKIQRELEKAREEKARDFLDRHRLDDDKA